jgi:signal recognition particle receptor subunit beta
MFGPHEIVIVHPIPGLIFCNRFERPDAKAWEKAQELQKY